VADPALVIDAALNLGSWWVPAILPVTVVVLMLPILDEERALAEGHPRQAEYLQEVRYRLFPRVWQGVLEGVSSAAAAGRA